MLNLWEKVAWKVSEKGSLDRGVVVVVAVAVLGSEMKRCTTDLFLFEAGEAC